MLRYIVGTSLKFRFLVIAIAAGMVYFGMGQLRHMPVDVFPEFAPPLVEIQTPSLGLAAAEVEALVTVPLEQTLAGLPGLDTMRSKSVPSLSAIKLYFEREADLLEARQLVQERIALITLPTWASPPVLLPPLSATSRMMKIGISSKVHSVMDLSMITYWTIRQRLLRVPGVANVAIWGERLKMLQVQVDPERMRQHAVSLDEVMEATADSLDVGLLKYSDGHHIGTGGWLDTPNQRMPIRHVLPMVYDSQHVTPDPLANVVLRPKGNGDTAPLLLKDVADVVIDHQPMVGDGIINDDVGLLLIVEKFPWGNTLQVTAGVEASARCASSRSPRRGDRPRDLPSGHLHRDVDRQSEHGADHRQHSGGPRSVCVPLRVAGRVDQQHRDSLVADAGALVLYLRDATINTMILGGIRDRPRRRRR